MTEQEAIKNITAYVYMECENMPKQVIQALDIAKDAVRDALEYRTIEKRLADMFGKQLTLTEYVDMLEYALAEPGKPHPVNAKILTYEDADAWEAYKAIGTVEECRKAVEKQRAKKTVAYKATNRADCPVCGNTVRGLGKPFGNWCSRCGQKLDWSE